LWWRSQRRAPLYRSRTFDFSDALDPKDSAMVQGMRTFDDRSHYTYDAGRAVDDWYARDTVGLFVSPTTKDAALITRRIERARAFLEPFRPTLTRYVFIEGEPRVFEERLVERLADGLHPADEWSDT
jgi:hypothetical protein